ncbi:histidine kinase [Nocardioides sp. QY071]|uniref:sensor histidine kinase n=1 Tax=Nocardioides sp. QY071 TaxID=3044187 RepID=UPI00249AB048|nr:ATP-binding protein [Nocardioides sp. QY071]WGY01029.1 histidine kinase [Nocardioides sp. QY071]
MTDARSRPPLRWQILGWLVAGTAWLLSAGAVVALIGTGTAPTNVADWIMDVVTGAVYGGVVLMMLPRSRHPVVWILVLTALGCSASGLAAGYVALDGPWPGQDLAIYLPYWAWVPGVYATVAVVPLLVVPGGRRRWPAVTFAIAAIVVSTLPSLTVVLPGLPDNPFGVPVAWWQSLSQRLGLWPDRTVALFGALVWLWLLGRVLRTPAAERRGLGWLLAGHGAMVVALGAFLLPMSEDWMGTAAEVSGSLLLVAQLFLPAALLVLVLGQQLWGVDARVNRGVVWAVMTVAIALAYLLLVGVASQVLPRHSDVALALAVGLVGLGATPLRRVVQQRVDHLVYGSGADPARLLLSVDGQGGHDIDDLAARLSRSLRLADVRIVAAQAGEEPAAPAVRDHDATIALTSRGRPVGLLVASPRPGERLDRRTIGMLTEVAGLVGMTIDLMQSVQALTAARRRMTSIRHEERRMLRRDLHDGLGPALAGIRLGLIAARGMRDQGASEEMFDALERELTQQGEEVRRLSRSLVPLALDDGDLATALSTLADRFTADGLVVRVTVAEDVLLEVPVQVAVYQLASEALLNVRRHARATRCDVVLRRRADGDIVFSVADDGIGMAPGAADGIGLRSMRERAQELGGVLRLTSGPGTGSGTGSEAGSGAGTRIELRLPAPVLEADSDSGSAEDLGLPSREAAARAGQQ